MPTPTKYVYSIQNDFPNHKVSSDRLTLEIQASSIVVALDHIETTGDECDIWFKDPLSGGDLATLNYLVAHHSGEPLPQPAVLPDGTPLVAIAQRQADGIPQVALAPTTGDEVILATHNFCDKCSWFADSARVTGETLTDSGDGLSFLSAHTHWIDMISGRVHNDDAWVAKQKANNPQNPHGWQVKVYVDGVEATMREPFEVSGGDYEVLWDEGKVIFFASQTGKVITADYSYATTSTFYLQPDAGKILRILKAEADISIGAEMTDAIQYEVWGLADALAPTLGLPQGTMIPVSKIVYKRAQQIIAEAQGTYPQIEPVGATEAQMAMPLEEFRRKSRGTRTKISALPFQYSTTRDLFSTAKMEIRVTTTHHRAYVGDSVTLTFYCQSKDE